MLNSTLNSRLTACIEPEDAAHVVALKHGAKELTEIINICQRVLTNKRIPDNQTNFLYLRDAVFITELTNDNLVVDSHICNTVKGLLNVCAGICTQVRDIPSGQISLRSAL